MNKRVDVEFDQVEILTKKAVELKRTRNGHRTLATAIDEAEGGLNHGVRNLHQLVVSTAAATGAPSCGTGYRVENERTYHCRGNGFSYESFVWNSQKPQPL